MKIAMLIPDNRDEFRAYDEADPFFGPAPTALIEGLSQIAGIEVHVVCCTHRSLRSPAKIAQNIWYHSLVVSKWGWRLAYLGCIWKIRRKLHSLSPDIVHGQGTERYCALAAALSGFPNVVTIHGNMRAVKRALKAKLFSFHGLAALLETFTLKITDGVICLTSYTKRQVGKLSRHTWIVPNAVDSIYFNVIRAVDPNVTFACLANVGVYKNQIRLILALDELARKHTFRLSFAGKVYPNDPYGRHFLRLCGERSWCSYEGSLDPVQLRALLARVTAMILPSLEDNCPMVILEAMAAGVPVAASRIGGIPDLVREGVTGILFDPLRDNSVRAAVEFFLGASADTRKMGSLSREEARERFSPLLVAQSHVRIYHELLRAKSGGSGIMVL